LVKVGAEPSKPPREAKTSPESTRTSKKLPDKGSISRPKREMDDKNDYFFAALYNPKPPIQSCPYLSFCIFFNGFRSPSDMMDCRYCLRTSRILHHEADRNFKPCTSRRGMATEL
jgi:hypothetical protein